MPTKPAKSLAVVPNPHPDRDYEVSMTAPEFTCLCPLTGQPDFATIRIRYVPDQHLVELRSLKLYLWSYRDVGAFHEDVTNRILNDFVAAARPHWVEVVGDFNVRGGIKTEVRAVTGESGPCTSAPPGADSRGSAFPDAPRTCRWRRRPRGRRR